MFRQWGGRPRETLVFTGAEDDAIYRVCDSMRAKERDDPLVFRIPTAEQKFPNDYPYGYAVERVFSAGSEDFVSKGNNIRDAYEKTNSIVVINYFHAFNSYTKVTKCKRKLRSID